MWRIIVNWPNKTMLIRMVISLVAFFFLVCFTNKSKAAIVNDAPGDAFGTAPFSDFLEMELTETVTDYLFRVRFSDLSQGNNGCLLLDTDGNRKTQGSPYGTISEITIEFIVSILGICSAQLFQNGEGTSLDCWVSGNDFYVLVPKTFLAGTFPTMEVAAVAAIDFLCGGRDRIPDDGYWSPQTGIIHIDDDGLVLNSLSALTDPAGDEQSPIDLKGFETEKRGEHLVFRVHYHHSIEIHDFNEVTWNSVHLDLDKDLLTGFQNTSEIHPTFGIDASIQFFLYPWVLGGFIDATLYRQKPSEEQETVAVQVGKLSTDTSYRRLGNWVEFYIPIALLPLVTQQSVISLASMEPIDGVIDLYPDEGGLLLATGTNVPAQSCSFLEQTIIDPAGDSLGFGFDNDDLIQVTACQSTDSTLFTIKYTNLDMIGEALTALRMDLDSNNSTGEIISNFANNTQLGIEKTLVYQFSSTSGGPPAARQVGGQVVFFGGSSGGSPQFLAILVEGATGDLLRGVSALVTVQLGGAIYVTVPHRVFDDDGAMNFHAATMSTAFGTAVPSDEAPNSGVLSVLSQIVPPLRPVIVAPFNMLLLNSR